MPRQGLTHEHAWPQTRTHTWARGVARTRTWFHMVPGKVSHLSYMYWASAYTRVRSVLSKVSNPSLQVTDKNLAWACIVLGNDSHPSLQGPRQGHTLSSLQDHREGPTPYLYIFITTWIGTRINLFWVWNNDRGIYDIFCSVVYLGRSTSENLSRAYISVKYHINLSMVIV